MPFNFLPHTSDIKFEATGKDLNELFASSAEAFFSAMVSIEKVEPVIEKKIELEAQDLSQLMHDWLEELLYLFDAEFLVFSKFDVNVKGNSLSAKVRGERFDRARHEPSAGVKAVTYNELDVKKTSHGYTATVVLDV